MPENRTERFFMDSAIPASLLAAVRERRPLIHHITNYVTVNDCANITICAGAAPVMAEAPEEVADMVAVAGALVLNIGTLSAAQVEAMLIAGRRANDLGIPVILDPVGAGATPYRTQTVRELVGAGRPTIIRGNASEILALAGDRRTTRGVDSTAASDEALSAAQYLSEKHQCAVSISGAVDYTVEGRRVVKTANGHPMMTRVTGLGCTATALCGACAAVDKDGLAAAAKAMAVMGIAGEMAAEKAAGPGSLQMHFLDALYGLSREDVAGRLKIEVA